MKCPACQYELVSTTREGNPIVRNRGLLIKAGALVMICPGCKGDVATSPEVMKSLHFVATLFFGAPVPK